MTTFIPQSQNSYDYDELISCSKGNLFGEGNAQLPGHNMLMVDRITHIHATEGKYGKGTMIAELDIRSDLWFFGPPALSAGQTRGGREFWSRGQQL